MIVLDLLRNSIFLSLQDRRFQPIISESYLQLALYELNNLLDEWRGNIPFQTQFITRFLR